jgi:D-inositol-3-phosphate glycosyltransferase
VARFAVLSYHTSPLAQPGTGDSGGMNVYVRELSSALARLGHEVDVYTRADSPFLRPTVAVEPGFRVHNIEAGPLRTLARQELVAHVDEFTAMVRERFAAGLKPDVIHANYWLSGLSGHTLKHEFNVPLVVTFHTLERIKADTFAMESLERAQAEQQIIRCADAVLASCDVESDQIQHFYDADPTRVHVVPLGVEHAFFSPGHRPQARRALGLDANATMLLFVGRIQSLKGVDLALDTLIEMRARGEDAFLAILGGPSGSDGPATLAALHQRVIDAGVIAHVQFIAPQGHQLLSSWMRAADVTLIPSHAESFGLVALESSACGTPVVASAVGGLTTLVQPGVNGALLSSRRPTDWADAVRHLCASEDVTAMSNRCVLLARAYTWRRAADKVATLTAVLADGQLIRC